MSQEPSWGALPSFKDFVNTVSMNDTICGAYSLSKQAGISSEPKDLLSIFFQLNKNIYLFSHL
jgi:hypothetical protein